MSRTKEGIELEQNAEGAQPAAGQTSTQSDLDERLGAEGQTDYTAGRESAREFPRRSTSNRGRTESRTEPRNQYESHPYDQGPESSRYGGRERSRYQPRNELREGSGGVYRRDVELRREARGYDRPGRYRGYDERDLDRQDDHRGRGRHTHYGHPTYQDLRSGRSDYEDFELREADRRRTREYESDYNRGRRGFEATYAEEPSRAYDYYEDEPWVGGSAGYNYDYQTGPPGWGSRAGRYLLCADIMTKDVTSTSPRTGVREAADKMDDENVGSLPVVENGRLIGIVTDRDIVCRVVAEGRDSQATPVSAAMSEDIVTCRPDESALEAIRKMGEHQIRRIPVCDTNGRLRGIIALADVALEAERDRELAYALEQISQPTRSRSRRV